MRRLLIERHSDPLLRTDSIRVGRNFCYGLHRRERETSWRTHDNRNAGRDSLHHSGIALRGPVWARTIRHRDIRHVYAVSQSACSCRGVFLRLVIAFAIRGLKEFGDTSRKALIISYSEPERRGQMIGAYYLVRDLIVSAGAILGAYLWKLGPALNFLGAAAFGIGWNDFLCENNSPEPTISFE